MKRLIFAFSTAVIIFTGCVDKEKKAAQQLLDDVRLNIENKEYNLALSRLDTIDDIYKNQIEIRREGMRLRPLAIQGSTLQQLVSVDSLIAVLTIENEKIKENIRYVDNPVEGYYISAKEKNNFIGSNGIQARMSPDGVFNLVSSTNKPVKSTAVTLKAGEYQASTKSVEYDDERNYRRNGIEVITFMLSESDTLPKFAEAHKGEKMTLTFEGEKPYTIDFSEDDAERLIDMYNNANLVWRSKKAQFDKARLEKTLELSRSQQARTYPTAEN